MASSFHIPVARFVACLLLLGTPLAHAATEIAAGIAAATTSTSSSTSLPESFRCTVEYRLYDPVELTSIGLHSFANDYCRTSIKGATADAVDSAIVVDDLPSGFHGPSTFVTCGEDVHHSDCAPGLEDIPVWVAFANGPDGPLPAAPTICPVSIRCDGHACIYGTRLREIACGDADGSGEIRTIDALRVLRAAIGLGDCAPARCDANRDEGISAADALMVLASSVGLHVPMLCPPPCSNRTEF